MALEYRYLLKLVSIADNRHGELMEFFLIVEPRSGRNKWLAVFEQTEAGDPPVVHKTNNILEAQRMARSIYRSGGVVTIEDLAPEFDVEEEDAQEGSQGAPTVDMVEGAPMSKPTRIARTTIAANARPRPKAKEAPAAAPAPEAPAAPEPEAPAAPEVTDDVAAFGAPQARAVIHHHHVGSHGRVAIHALSRMLEDLRYSTIIKDTLGMRALFEGDALMVLRAQDIELLEPLKMSDELIMDLRLVDTGETSLQMGHRVWRTSDDALVARVTVSGVYLNAKRRPAPLPDGLTDLVTPDDEHEPPTRLTGKAPRDAWKLKLSVRPSDLDLLNHVNHGHTIRMLDDARLLAVRAGAYPETSGDLGGPITRCVVNYEREMVLGDDLTISTWSSAPGVARFEIRRGLTITARGHITVAQP